MEHGDRGRGEGRPRERGHHGVVEHGVAAGGRDGVEEGGGVPEAAGGGCAATREVAATGPVGVGAEESRGVARSGRGCRGG